MNEPGGASEQRDARPKILATISAVGAILVFVTGVAYLLTRANPGALGAASWAVFTTSLIGVIVMTYVFAVRRSASRSAPPMDDIDAELYRILADARLGDLSSRRGRGRGAP
ncbi:MAG TPA: hypothetical protein VJS45_12745 [Acidimicrobiia bacterium]|nr:hypothetical protein [Acidimicrobiia bacterium]